MEFSEYLQLDSLGWAILRHPVGLFTLKLREAYQTPANLKLSAFQ